MRVDLRLGKLRGALGALTVVACLQPVPLIGQERAPGAVRAPSGARIPAMGADQVKSADAEIAALLGTAGAEKRISRRLTHQDRATVADLGNRLRGGATFAEIRTDWTALLSRSELTSEQDVDDLARWVLREGFGHDERLGKSDTGNALQEHIEDQDEAAQQARDRSADVKTGFQNSDERANQHYRMLRSMLDAMQDTRKGSSTRQMM